MPCFQAPIVTLARMQAAIDPHRRIWLFPKLHPRRHGPIPLSFNPSADHNSSRRFIEGCCKAQCGDGSNSDPYSQVLLYHPFGFVTSIHLKVVGLSDAQTETSSGRRLNLVSCTAIDWY